MPEAARSIVFDDGGGMLSPLTDLRASFDVRTGAVTTLERLARGLSLNVAAVTVPPHLEGVTRDRHGAKVTLHPTLDPRADDGNTLLINGRCVLAAEEVRTLRPGQTLVEAMTGDVVAHRVAPGNSARQFFDRLAARPDKTAMPGEVVRLHRHVLLSRPWHIRTFRDSALNVDLIDIGAMTFDYKLPGLVVFGEMPLRIAPSAKLYPGTIFDLENGHIVIDEHAVIRPGCTIIGPAYIGKHSTVLDRALIKANTAIGPWCKVAGEIGGTIFQGYANKSHDGHLGDSWVGEWANLGAGTTNSNLLNTYAEVTARATPTAMMERTGESFLGAIIGDHVKTAICTRIMTGAIVGTGTMWAAAAPISGTTGPFGWVTDDAPPGAKQFRMDKFMAVASTAMARRKVTPSAAYATRMRELAEPR